MKIAKMKLMATRSDEMNLGALGPADTTVGSLHYDWPSSALALVPSVCCEGLATESH